eukprot:292322-Chlamydomonas_euryale.AAC.10
MEGTCTMKLDWEFLKCHTTRKASCGGGGGCMHPCSGANETSSFQELLAEAGFNGGDPIDEEYFRVNISGRHNPEIAADLFPSWTEAQQTAFSEAKEQRFRDLAGCWRTEEPTLVLHLQKRNLLCCAHAGTNLKRLPGLSEFMAWLDVRGLRKGAVTNAPKANTHLMLGALGLETYFESLVLGEECTRAKPFPDPYLEGLKKLGLDAQATLVVEDSPAGIKVREACVTMHMLKSPVTRPERMNSGMNVGKLFLDC